MSATTIDDGMTALPLSSPIPFNQMESSGIDYSQELDEMLAHVAAGGNLCAECAAEAGFYILDDTDMYSVILDIPDYGNERCWDL